MYLERKNLPETHVFVFQSTFKSHGLHGQAKFSGTKIKREVSHNLSCLYYKQVLNLLFTCTRPDVDFLRHSAISFVSSVICFNLLKFNIFSRATPVLKSRKLNLVRRKSHKVAFVSKNCQAR